MSEQSSRVRELIKGAAENRISRRRFVRELAELGVSSAVIGSILGMAASSAASSTGSGSNRLVVMSWGGGYGAAQRETIFEPFTQETGIEIVLAPQQPDISLVEAQVTTGNVELDLANFSFVGAYTLGNRGMLESIDYSAMDSSVLARVDDHVKGEHSVGMYYWTMVLGYSLDFFKKGDQPRNWADFWNVEKFPGPRGLQSMDFEPPPLEIPILANGGSVDSLYPLDIEQAFQYLTEFREHVTTWTGYAVEGYQLLAQGELAMSTAVDSGTTAAAMDGANIDKEWAQGLRYFDAWVIPKGSRNKEQAHKFIEFCLRPEIQAAFMTREPLGVIVPEANDLIPLEIRKHSVSAPENLEKTIAVDPQWWTAVDADGKTNVQRVYDKWATWIL